MVRFDLDAAPEAVTIPAINEAPNVVNQSCATAGLKRTPMDLAISLPQPSCASPVAEEKTVDQFLWPSFPYNAASRRTANGFPNTIYL